MVVIHWLATDGGENTEVADQIDGRWRRPWPAQSRSRISATGRPKASEVAWMAGCISAALSERIRTACSTQPSRHRNGPPWP